MTLVETNPLSAIDVKLRVGDDNDSLVPIEVNGINIEGASKKSHNQKAESALFSFEDLDYELRHEVVQRVTAKIEDTEAKVAYYSRNWIVRKREIIAGSLTLAATAIADYIMVSKGYNWDAGYLPEVLCGGAGYFVGVGWLADGVANIGYSKQEFERNSNQLTELDTVKTLALGWIALPKAEIEQSTSFVQLGEQELQSWSDIEGQLQTLRNDLQSN